MTANPPYPAHSGVGKLLLMALVLATGVIAFISPGMKHAIERHGEDAITVSQCLNKHGSIQIWLNKDTGRQAEICQIGPEKFGIRISTDDLKETITQFIKNKLTHIEQVERYLTNRGYIRIR